MIRQLIRMTCLLLLSGAALAPQAADWSVWQERLPINLARVDAETIGLLPLDVTFSLKAEQMSDPNRPERELRLIHEADGQVREIPFQLSRAALWNKDTDTTLSVPTFSAMMTFFPPAGEQDGNYFILAKNPQAEPPTYETDLKVSGEGPHWTIENSLLRIELREADAVKSDNPHDAFGDSGQIATIHVKSRPEAPISNRHRSVHWEPGIFIPQRGWLHVYAWDPPEEFELESGPIFIEVRRRGPLPGIPEVDVAVTYRLFAERDFVEVGSRMDVLEDLGTVSLRNNNCVFDDHLFSRMAWEQQGEVFDHAIDDYRPVNRHGDLVRLEPDTPWFALYNPETGVGASTVMIDESNVGPMAGPPTLFDHAFYFTKGHGLVYWFRPQIYYLIDWDRQQLMRVPKGSIYAERNLYRYFDVERGGAIEGTRQLARAARNTPDIKVGPYIFAPPQ